MASNNTTLQNKLENFEAACHDAGLKLTHQRFEIYRELASSKDHPTAEILYKKLKKDMPSLSLDTVYRTLTTFEEHDLITRVQTAESHARFEAETDEHHHAVCSRCHNITDFHWDICDTNRLPSTIEKWGKIQNKQITLKGICTKCEQEQKKSW